MTIATITALPTVPATNDSGFEAAANALFTAIKDVMIGEINTMIGQINVYDFGLNMNVGNIVGLTAGRIPFGTGTGALSSSASLFWDNANGNLGIGTASPYAKLHVAIPDSGVSPFVAVFGGDLTPAIPYTGFDTQYGINTVEIQGADSGSYGTGNLQLRSTLANEYGGSISWVSDNTDNSDKRIALISAVKISDGTYYDSADMVFYSRGIADSSIVERMRITSSGNVGIGTASPATKLDVDGVIKVKSYTVATQPSAVVGGIIYVSDDVGGAVLAFSDGSDWRRVTDRSVTSTT